MDHVIKHGIKHVILSDRRRVELALPAAMLFRVFSSCVDVAAMSAEPGQLTGDRMVLDLLTSAAVEPLDGLAPKEANKLAKRITRLQRDLLMDFEDRPVMVVFLVILFWLKGLLDSEHINLIEGSTFDRAVAVLIPELERHEDLWLSVEKSALRNARRISNELTRLGYYK